MKFTSLILGALLASATVAPTLAATATAPTPLATLLPAPAATSAMSPSTVGDVPLATTIVSYRAVAYGERASKIIGATVYNDQKQAIGRVADLVVDPHDAVSFVIVSVGGFLGINAKDVAVSAKYFQFAKDHVLLPRATKQVLQQLPAFHFSH